MNPLICERCRMMIDSSDVDKHNKKNHDGIAGLYVEVTK